MRPKGFSLVEVVVALGVISFALVAIIGMFPVAMNASKDSRNETQAAFIAQLILGHIRSQSATNSSFPVGPDPTSSSASDGFQSLSLKQNIIFFSLFNQRGEPVRRSTAQQYNDGIQGSLVEQAEFIARLTVAPDSPTNGLAKVSIDVTSPASAPLTNRRTATFVTFLRNTAP